MYYVYFPSKSKIAVLFWRPRQETLPFAAGNLTLRAAAMCRDQNKAAPRSYRQPVGQADSRVHGAESSAAEHRTQSVKLLKRLFLLFGYKKTERNKELFHVGAEAPKSEPRFPKQNVSLKMAACNAH